MCNDSEPYGLAEYYRMIAPLALNIPSLKNEFDLRLGARHPH
jgi:hypothetical protein